MDNKGLAYAEKGADAAGKRTGGLAALRGCPDQEPARGQKKISWWKVLLLFSLLTMFPGIGAQQATAMTRTIQKEPAIVITAFGTTTDARATFDFFEKQLAADLPEQFRNYKVAWAFTSEIVRERANKKFKEAGSDRRYLSLAQTLANLEDQGYRKIALQSLHIFPGQEYRDMQKVIEAFRRIGLRIEYGGTLLHEWPWLFAAIDALEKEFLAPDQGCNVLVAHGTPQTFPGSNSTYLGLDRYLSRKYSNVFAGGVDGVLTREQALDQAKACQVKRVRFIPFMYVAGDHIMNDIMGPEADDQGLPSWAMELEQAGIKVDTVHTTYQNRDFFKGLGFYEKINRMFIQQLVESLERLEKY